MSNDPTIGLERRAPAATGTSAETPSADGSAGVRIRARNIAILLFVGALWGVQPALIKAALGEGMSEIQALSVVMMAVAGVLGGVLAAQGRLFWPSATKLRFMTVSGTAEYAAPLFVAFLIAPHIDAGLLTLIVSTTPVFTVVLAAAVGADPLNRLSVAACVLGVLAMGLIVVPENALPSGEMLPWCIAAFAIPVIYSCGTIYVSRAWPRDMDAIQVAFGGALLAGILLAPSWLSPFASNSLAGKSSAVYLAFAALILTLVLEMVLYFFLLRHAGPVFSSFSSFVMILTGFLAGAVFFDERPSVWIWGSVALFSLAVLLVILKPTPPSITAGK